MKPFYLQLLFLALVTKPMFAQKELAAIEVPGKSNLEYQIDPMIELVSDNVAGIPTLDLSVSVEAKANENQPGTSIVHLVDQSTAQDSMFLSSDGTVHLDPTEPILLDALFMHPNPTSGIVQIKLQGKLSIQVYTLEGQLVSKHHLATGERFLNLTSLPPGFYQVRVKSDEDYFSGKLLIQ